MPVSVDDTRLRLKTPSGTEGVLLGFRCRACGICVFGPATFCQNCTSGDLEAVELSNHGVLFSHTVVRVPPAGWPGPVPYTLGQVELPEGPQVLAEVIGCAESALKVGMVVELALKPMKDTASDKEIIVYKWQPVSGP